MKHSAYHVYSPPEKVDDVLFDMTYYEIDHEVVEHSHDCIEITIIFEGEARHISKDFATLLHRGDVCVTLPGGTHGMKDCRHLCLYNISCSREILEKTGVNLSFLHGMREMFSGPPRAILFHLNSTVFSDASRIIRKMFDTYRKKTKAEHGDLRSGFAMLLCLLAQAYSSYEKADSVPGRLERAIEYINSHYKEPLKLGPLAAMGSLSVSQFIRTFKREYGLTPIGYSLELRHGEAVRLLRDTSLSVSEIAFLLGFSDSNYFTHFFTLKQGESPLKFRRRFETNSPRPEGRSIGKA